MRKFDGLFGIGVSAQCTIQTKNALLVLAAVLIGPCISNGSGNNDGSGHDGDASSTILETWKSRSVIYITITSYKSGVMMIQMYLIVKYEEYVSSTPSYWNTNDCVGISVGMMMIKKQQSSVRT